MSDQLDFDFSPPPPPIAALPELWTPDDIFASVNEELIKRFSEDRRVERKSARAEPKDLADNLVMYANTQPHGNIAKIVRRFTGLHNNGQVICGFQYNPANTPPCLHPWGGRGRATGPTNRRHRISPRVPTIGWRRLAKKSE